MGVVWRPRESKSTTTVADSPWSEGRGVDAASMPPAKSRGSGLKPALPSRPQF